MLSSVCVRFCFFCATMNPRVQVVGIIDYMRQYDIIKRMERMGKSVSMIAGQAEPTIVQPSLYKTRFQQVSSRPHRPPPRGSFRFLSCCFFFVFSN